jgi:UDP-N-acetylenolpyruvoylglucosamine reductase
MELARAVRAAVHARFGVTLEIEPTLVGLTP